MQTAKPVTGMHVFLVLWKAFRAIEIIDKKSISSLGLGGHSDFAILEMLSTKGAMPINAIGKKVGLTSGSITTAMDRAESKGWVERSYDKDDRRVVLANLTAEGNKIIKNKMPQHAAALERASEVLSEDEKTTLISLLKKLGYHAQENHENIINNSQS